MKRVLGCVLLASIVLSAWESVAMVPSDAVMWDSEGVTFLPPAPAPERSVAATTRPHVTFDIDEPHAPASSSFWKDCRSVFCIGLTLTFLVILAVRLWIWAAQPEKRYLVDNLETLPTADNGTDFQNITKVSTSPVLERSILSPAMQWCADLPWQDLSKTLKRTWGKCSAINPPLSIAEDRKAKIAFILGGGPSDKITHPWNQTLTCQGLPARIREWLHERHKTNSSITNEPCSYRPQEA